MVYATLKRYNGSTATPNAIRISYHLLHTSAYTRSRHLGHLCLDCTNRIWRGDVCLQQISTLCFTTGPGSPQGHRIRHAPPHAGVNLTTNSWRRVVSVPRARLTQPISHRPPPCHHAIQQKWLTSGRLCMWIWLCTCPLTRRSRPHGAGTMWPNATWPQQ